LSSSCDAEVEWLRQRAETVEVIMPDVQPEVGVEETVGSTDLNQVEGKLLVMLINFVWMKICCFRLVCNL
jgi:hypothetical protein